MSGYVGPGFVGTIAALRRIVEVRHPDRWAPEAIPDDELETWDGLGPSLAGELWAEHLRARLRLPPSPMLMHRIVDYQEAYKLLRDALVSGNILAKVVEDDGAIREIEPRCWLTDDGGYRLLAGSCWIDEGPTEVCRLILLAEAEVKALHDSPSSNARVVTPDEDDIKRRRRGPSVVPEVVAWLAAEYPTGLPPTLPRKRILAKILAAEIPASMTTLRRAVDQARNMAAPAPRKAK